MNLIKKMAHNPKGSFICLAVAALLLWAGGRAGASTADVGLVTNLSGEATYANQTDQKQPVPAQAFMKVRQGDQFKLSPGSKVQVVYFDNGRQETWTGPATFVAGAGESRLAGEGQGAAAPEVKILPAKVSKRLGAPNLPLPRAGLRYSGVIQTMAPECKTSTPAATCVKPLDPKGRKEIKEAQEVYQNMREQTAPGDLTPEFFLGSWRIMASTGR